MKSELKSLTDSLDKLKEAWGKDQSRHYTEMFAAIARVLHAYDAYKLATPTEGAEKRGNLRNGQYSMM